MADRTLEIAEAMGVTRPPPADKVFDVVVVGAPGWWLHLRRCAQCGHIGRCDSSPSQHASTHARTVGHPVITSFEPGEDWFYQHNTKKFFRGPRLPDPQSRPLEQSAPAPADKVPADWRDRIHR
ncbi:UBP-type zinc finger domain-containing protein [Arthrobacter sp. Z1-9]